MNKVFTLLKIEADERRSVVLIMLLSFFLGVFNGTFYIGSHSQFLDTFGKDEIANAYVISGVVGIVMTFIYAFFQSRTYYRYRYLLYYSGNHLGEMPEAY